MQASRAIETGDAELILVGGVESMSRAPWVVQKPEKGFPAGPQTMHSHDARLAHGQPGDARPVDDLARRITEKLAGIHNVGREAQDEFALRSHQLAAKAWDEGFYDDWVVARTERSSTRDEGIRADSQPGEARQAQARLRRRTARSPPATRRPLNDGAAAVLIGSRGRTATPLARIAGRGTHAVDPDIFGIAPVEAANKALARAGITWDDVDLVELNEAFAAQSLACVNEWPIDPEKVNVFGGAIAIGHPLGASGARILGTLVHGLHKHAAAATASPRSASASARASRWWSRRHDDFRDDARRPPADGLRGLQVDGAPAPQAAADHPAPAAHRGHRPGLRRRPRQARRQRPHPGPRAASRSASGSSSTATSRKTTGAPCRTRWSRSGRPTPAAATATRSTTGRARWTPTSPAAAARSPTPDGYFRFLTIKPGAYPWKNHPNAWRPAHIHFSLFGRAFTQRLVTQMYFPDDPLFFQDPMYNSVRDERAAKRMVSAFDYDATEDHWALAYRWDIVLRGEEATPTEEAHA